MRGYGGMDGLYGALMVHAAVGQSAALQNVRSRIGEFYGRADVVCVYYHSVLSCLASYC